MIYKLTSSKVAISKILADLNINEDSQRISDIVEWIGEALEKIGSVKQLERRISGVDGEPVLSIKNNQVKIPFGLFRLNTVSYSVNENGPWFVIKPTQSPFSVWSTPSNQSSTGDIAISDRKLVDTVKGLYAKYVEDPIYSWFSKMDDKTALEILNTNYNVRVILTNLIRSSEINGSKTVNTASLLYSIKPGYIYTNVPSGYIKLSYDRMPIDDDGYPMIPDSVSYMEAIYWYVVMKLSYPEYRAGRMRQDIYYDARRSWNFYCKQAYAESIMPTQDEMEVIGTINNRLVPILDSNTANTLNNYYDEISSRELIYQG